MVDIQIIIKKIDELTRTVHDLKRLRSVPLEKIRTSCFDKWAIERGLQIAIQCLLDIGNHVLAEIGENGIEDYTDVIVKLGEKNVIPAEFAKEIRGMAGFRNILVHEYLEIDINKLYDMVQNRLPDFERFIGYIKTALK
ncbi:MAG: DUF86 domain-containing protein [Candidatus Omnitrophica bacterium]|nr:DUF86 domain-containing protein [Candidatus Omnitrophota bacterium]